MIILRGIDDMSNLRRKIKKVLLGFTLAEVLIVIGIIGVVAAITIPALVKDYQDTQYKVAFKRNYALLSEATKQIAADNGNTLVGTYTPNNSMNGLQIAYKNYLKYDRICSSADDTNSNSSSYLYKCWTNQICTINNNCGGVFPVMPVNSAGSSGTSIGSGTSWNNIYYLINGASVVIGDYSSFSYKINNTTIIGGISLDTNGPKPPNTIGKDIYVINVLENGNIAPVGVGITNSNADFANCTTIGNSCGQKYLLE